MTSDYPVSPDKSGVGHSAFLTLIDSHDLPQTWLPQTREQPEMPKRKKETNNLISLFEAIYSIHKVYGGMLIYLLLCFAHITAPLVYSPNQLWVCFPWMSLHSHPTSKTR